jgi:hypothetical protein
VHTKAQPLECLHEERGVSFQLVFVLKNDGGVIGEAKHV